MKNQTKAIDTPFGQRDAYGSLSMRTLKNTGCVRDYYFSSAVMEL